MHVLLGSTGSFLLAVLWMDLMFDVQVLGAVGPLDPQAGALPAEVVDSIAAYYHRVTTAANPMGHLVGVVMGITLVGLAVQLRSGDLPLALRLAAAVCAALPIGLALVRILPNAIELGTGAGTLAHRSELARSIFREHVLCALLIATFIGLQLRIGYRALRAPRRDEA